MPIIQDLIEKGHSVTIAAGGAQKKLLQYYFPNATYLSIPNYNIRYSKKAWWLPFALFFQLPKMALAIYKEHRWLQANMHLFDHVISDNRYGVRSALVPSVYMTHQINVLSGTTTFLTSYIHQKIIKKFDSFIIKYISCLCTK